MKKIFLLLAVSAFHFAGAQIKIHSHNDYEQAVPLFNAINQKAWCIEADIFPIGNKLFVAHSKGQIDSAKTLLSMYIRPIDSLFQLNKGSISVDTSYVPVLMIDIKESPAEAVRLLTDLLSARKKTFDKKFNPLAMQVMLSGERGSVTDWLHYPDYLFIDGRPYESYGPDVLPRVMMISDNYFNYVTLDHPERKEKLVAALEHIHQLHKPARFWAAPDNEQGWKMLKDLGIDIISTNRVAECRAFFQNHN